MRLPRRGANGASAESGSPARALIVAIAIAWACVILRSLIFLLYEQSFFDSDQAIVGLMAKHLAEGRAFPLFYYGQTYMLAVDAWAAAPVFLVAGASVASLHAAIVLLNLVVVTLLVVGLTRCGGLRPLQAAVAVSFFAFAPPLTAASLIEAGANIGPFIYVALLWMLRDRPLWFGFVLALGFLNREFTIYALPALVLRDLWSRELWQPARLRTWLVAMVAALATWQGIQALKPAADLMGPHTRGALVGGLGGSQVGNIADRVSLRPAEYPERAGRMYGEHLPRLFGARRVEHPIASQGRDWMVWVLAAGLGTALLRAAWTAVRYAGFASSAFGWYLFAVGTTAAWGYIATRPGPAVVDRYILLTLLMPIGVVAVSLALDRSRLWRGLVVAFVAVWTASSAVDHAAHARRYLRGDQPNEIRVLADALVSRGIRIAEAPYWRAYKVTFMADEQVIVASNDVVRIWEYRRLANEARPDLVRVQERRCVEGEAAEQVGGWYLCRARPQP